MEVTMQTSDVPPTPAPRKQSTLQAGIECLRDANVLEECKTRLQLLTDTIRTNSNVAFDVLYMDIPWKHTDLEYLKGLPVKDLVGKDQVSGMLLWADSTNLLDAFKLLRTWGFTFHSVMHIVSYENRTHQVSTGGSEVGDDAGNGGVTEGTPQVQPVKTSTSKKTLAPHGWQTSGIINCRSRQLLFAYSGDGSQDVNFSRIFKDFSFIRKRLGQVSTFSYPEATTENVTTGLSSKKKNIENWIVYPDYDVYCPTHLRGTLETFFKPTTRVLSLFTSGLSKNWYSWGPNVPGYLNGPLRPDSGFGLLCALQKYFSCMKTATVNKYLTLINLYIIQLAKQEGASYFASNQPSGGVDEVKSGSEPCIGTLVRQRFSEFLSDLQRKAESGGGVKDGPLSHLSLIQLKDLPDCDTNMSSTSMAQLLVQVAQVVKHTLRKISEAASHRKKGSKRKHEGAGEDSEAKPAKSTTPRKYGIAAPVDISPELATFMDIPIGTAVARTAVVKYINKYIVDNSLQNPERKSEILVQKDEKLLRLLNPDSNFGTVTYFNLCKLLGPHFVKGTKQNGTPDPVIAGGEAVASTA